MSLLAPLFLIGLPLIALPIWLHRLQVQNSERKSFSSTMLLESSQQQVLLKKKLRYLLLLAIRILLLLLMAFTFAKPILNRDVTTNTGGNNTLHVIVIDTSLSMRYGDWMSDAITIAKEIVGNMTEGDMGQLISAGDTTTILAGPTPAQEELQQALNKIQVGTGRVEFGRLVEDINSIINESTLNLAIHLISDFQMTNLPSRFAELIPDQNDNKEMRLELYPVGNADAVNLSIDSVSRIDSNIEVRVRGYNNIENEITVTLRNNNEIAGEQTRFIKEDGVTRFQFQDLEFITGDNLIETIISLNDLLTEDDQMYTVFVNQPPKPVLLITDDLQSLAVTYLTAAIETGPRGYNVEPVLINEIDPRIVQRYSWIVIDDLGIVNETLATTLVEYLHSGGAILAAIGDRSLSLTVLPVSENKIGSVAMTSNVMPPIAVSWVDSSHPALVETSGWRDINVARSLNLELGENDNLLITLDNGKPLLLEQKLGQGKILLILTGVDNVWSDIPLRPVFVNFIAEAAGYLSDEVLLDQNQLIGTTMQLKQSGTAAGQVIDPHGNQIFGLAETLRTQDIKLNEVGFYQIYTTGNEATIAVNPDPLESDLTIMAPSELARWSNAGTVTDVIGDANSEVTIHQDPYEVWYILLIVLAVVVVVESVLGNSYLAFRQG